MCRQRLPLGAIICLLGVFITHPSAQAEQAEDKCTLTMGWEPWHPYQFIDAQGSLTGFDIDFVDAITSSMDCSVVHREVNWARGLVDLKNGDLDLITNANFTQERSEWAHYTDSYRDSSVVLFMRKGESNLYPLESLSDIAGTDFRLGIGRGVLYSDEVTRLVENPAFKQHLVYIPTSELQQYEMLQASRIDGFIRSGTALESLRELVGSNINLEVHPYKINGAKQHIILSKKSVSIAQYEQFNEALRGLQKTGVLDSLLAKYF